MFPNGDEVFEKSQRENFEEESNENIDFQTIRRVKIPKELDFVGGGKNDRFDKKAKSLDFNKNNLKFLNHL